MGDHRAGDAPIPPQPDADRRVDGLSRRPARRAGLRVWRERQAPEGGDRRSGSRRAGGEGARAGVGRRVRGEDDRHRRVLGSGAGDRGPAERAGQRRADDPAGLLAAGALEERSARRARRRQHRYVRVGHAGRHSRQPGRVVRVPVAAAAGPRAADAGRGGGLSVRAVRAVPPARFRRHVDFHDGDDRRRDHLHRRQGARAARRLSRDADHEVRADCRIQHLGDGQGRARGDVPRDHRLPHCRHSPPVRPAQAPADLRRDRRHGVRAHQPHVPADGEGERSAPAAGDVRRAEHAALLSERGGVSAAGVSRLDAGHRRRRSVHVLGARAQEPAAEEHGAGGDHVRSGVPAHLSVAAMSAATLLFRRTL